MSDITEIKTYRDNVVLMEVPANYRYVYEQLLKRMSRYGESLLDDCSSTCKSANKQLTICWNMFQAACAAYQRGEIKKADLLIKYITRCMKLNDEEVIDVYIGEIDYEDELTEEYIVENFQNVPIPYTGNVVYTTAEIEKDIFVVAIPKDSITNIGLKIVDEFKTDLGTDSWNEDIRLIQIGEEVYEAYTYKAPPSGQLYEVSINETNYGE